ncbi:GNAT family N-acetyltransferase [Pedobacter alpinus]|uniref:GNAT family N-acetyltransferase n=1 Tax=Pedobacter alpinus TaxID=1590643 RepID=A0ABW5TRA3_9SPHI
MLIRTNSENLDFQNLVIELDKDLAIRDGEIHSFYAQFNKIAAIKYVIVAYENEMAVGCGAIKEYNADTMEVKRMYVEIKNREKGIARMILKELENWAKELGYKKLVLETGNKQPEALHLYKSSRFNVMENYGQYAGLNTSICFYKEF